MFVIVVAAGALAAAFALTFLAIHAIDQLISRGPDHGHGRVLATRDAAFAEVEAARVGKGKPRRGWLAFIRKWLTWIATFLRYRLTPKKPLVELEPGQGTFRMQSHDGARVRIAITGDWGKGDEHARRVGNAMSRCGADYTIHLGDIYSVGSRREVESNFTGTEPGDVAWPKGQFGALAVPGNHEYQSGAHAFYDLAMKGHLGVKEGDTELAQPATYFSIENEHWRVIGLDTGFHSVKKIFWELFVRLLNVFRRKHPWAQKLKTKLPDHLVTWLKPLVNGDKSLIFLSHHQYLTTLDKRGSHPQPGEQIAAEVKSRRTAVWLCGHGHRLEIHEPVEAGDKLTVLSRTVGHGAETDVVTLTEEKEAELAESPLRFADNRLAPGETRQGFTGFAVLDFEGADLSVDYVTLGADGTQTVYRESLSADQGSATIGSSSHAHGEGFWVASGLPSSAERLPAPFELEPDPDAPD